MVRRVIVISFFGVVIPVCAPLRGHPAEGTSDAAEAIWAALAGLGLPERVWGSVRPMVTHSGTFHADAAEEMAEAMQAPGST
ncbi:hypothetical protein QQM39_09680 [Streptomyces sp. DT2A-34]|uniref:hypothetical protein n=1 Tax=Streptomyces sp. DT2A-34 TaxID=3051182 RepID=UPI00265BFDC7|nr:hypothetical protein [Streptomyces sp. DT2A-34]MDO0911113.1 hypothetical protein [Streptomyces sp. DT2A-34]